MWESIVSGDGASKQVAEVAFTKAWSVENAFLASRRIPESHRVVVGAVEHDTKTELEGEVVVGYIVRREVDVYGSDFDELAAYNREMQMTSASVWSTFPRGVPTTIDILVVAWLALASFSVGSFQRARGESAKPGMSIIVVIAHLVFIASAIVLSFYFIERKFWPIDGLINVASALLTLYWVLLTRTEWSRAGLSRVPYWLGACVAFFVISAAFGALHL
jgi:hypothetical protein